MSLSTAKAPIMVLCLDPMSSHGIQVCKLYKAILLTATLSVSQVRANIGLALTAALCSFSLFFNSDQMQELKAEGIEVDTQRASDDALDDLMAHGGYSALIVRSANTVRESTITPGLKVIGRAGAGNRSIT
jgi:hypothetical protein